MICLEFNWFFYDPSWMLQISEFVWSLRSLAWVVLNNFLLIDATDRSKISSNQKHSFFAVSLYPLLFFANTPFNLNIFAIFHDHIQKDRYPKVAISHAKLDQNFDNNFLKTFLKTSALRFKKKVWSYKNIKKN